MNRTERAIRKRLAIARARQTERDNAKLRADNARYQVAIAELQSLAVRSAKVSPSKVGKSPIQRIPQYRTSDAHSVLIPMHIASDTLDAFLSGTE